MCIRDRYKAYCQGRAIGEAGEAFTVWEDDPVPGEMWVRALGDDDEEIEPAKVIMSGRLNDMSLDAMKCEYLGERKEVADNE